MKKFWTVWKPNDNSRQPRVRHLTEESAIVESQRLAKLEPDNVFYVMEAKVISRVNTVTTERLL